MAGRRLAVLGGCGGIGRGLVAAALAEGWTVALLDLPASLDRHPPPAPTEAIAIDLTSARSVEDAFERLARLSPGLEGFVNLAGFMSPLRPLAETVTEDFDSVIAGNLRGAFLAARAALPLLRSGREPSLVNIASGLGAFVRPHYGPYAAAKAGMIALTKTLALEAAPQVRANAVAPGAVDTAFLRGGTGRSEERNEPSLDVEAYARMIPLRRIAEVEDVIGPILFLLSPASRYMTGQVLWVNGGAYMP